MEHIQTVIGMDREISFWINCGIATVDKWNTTVCYQLSW